MTSRRTTAAHSTAKGALWLCDDTCQAKPPAAPAPLVPCRSCTGWRRP